MKSFNIQIMLLVFMLSSCDLFLGPEPDTSPEGILKSLWNDFNDIHAFLDIRMSHNHKYSDWYDVYHNEKEGYARYVRPDMSSERLFVLCARMLMELNDPHVGLYAPGLFAASYTDSGEEFDINKAVSMLKGEGSIKYENFLYGVFSEEPQIGYIYIASLAPFRKENGNQDWGKNIDKILKELADTKAIVLDLRDNRGGDIYISEYIASRFASAQKDYMKSGIKNGPGNNDLSEIKYYRIKPAGVRYTKPVILLTNKGTTSAAEWFSMALLTQNHVTHTGTPTCGAFSMRVKRPMLNGWYYTISAERVTDMNGNIFEGIGMSPMTEHIVINDKSDAQLSYALELAVIKGN